jgi:hypothetical protein
MKCHDIALILDDRRIEELSAKDRNQVEIHVSECADCAEGWEIHRRIDAMAIPVLPESLARWHPRGRAASVTRISRWRSRSVIVGMLLLGCAAAAMYALTSSNESEQIVSSERAFDGPSATTDANELRESAAVMNVADSEVVRSAGTEVGTRSRVLILPPIHNNESEIVHDAVDGVHRSMVRFFQTRPDIEAVVVTDAELSAAEAKIGELLDRPERVREGERDRAVRRELRSNYSVRVSSREFAPAGGWMTAPINRGSW